MTNNELDGGVSYIVAASNAVASNGFIAITTGFLASFIAARSTVTGNWTIPDGDIVSLRDESPRKQAAANLTPVI